MTVRHSEETGKVQEVKTARVWLDIDSDSYRLLDLTDRDNATTAIPKTLGVRSVQRLQKWLASNAAELEDKTFGQCVDLLRDAGLKLHVFCAMD